MAVRDGAVRATGREGHACDIWIVVLRARARHDAAAAVAKMVSRVTRNVNLHPKPRHRSVMGGSRRTTRPYPPSFLRVCFSGHVAQTSHIVFIVSASTPRFGADTRRDAEIRGRAAVRCSRDSSSGGREATRQGAWVGEAAGLAGCHHRRFRITAYYLAAMLTCGPDRRRAEESQ